MGWLLRLWSNLFGLATKPLPVTLDKSSTAAMMVSTDGEYYFLVDYRPKERFWLEIAKRPGAVTAKEEHGAMFVMIRKNDGTVYHRRMLPYAYRRAKLGVRDVPLTDDLVMDYLTEMKRREEQGR